MLALHIQDLIKTYSNGVEALKGISLRVKEGDFFALLGPNGAGKSTLISIITSLVVKTSGSVLVFGHDISDEGETVKASIGVVPQEFNFNIFEKVENILLCQAGYYGIPRKLAKQRAEKYLKKLGLWEKRNAVARSLSGGMKRRLMIARALMHEPKMLILDEPTAGVDIEIRHTMWQFLKEINKQGTTIILTTHYLEEAENLCRNIAIIDQGRVVEDSNMPTLLGKLEHEILILYVENPLFEAPQLTGFTVHNTNEDSVEVGISRDQTLNQLFEQLAALGIVITGMRNKSNRLETLFMNLTGRDSA